MNIYEEVTFAEGRMSLPKAKRKTNAEPLTNSNAVGVVPQVILCWWKRKLLVGPKAYLTRKENWYLYMYDAQPTVANSTATLCTSIFTNPFKRYLHFEKDQTLLCINSHRWQMTGIHFFYDSGGWRAEVTGCKCPEAWTHLALT